MALIMNQNLYSLTGQFYLGINQNALSKSIERLSSGLRINHASDDASGMAISEKMRGQISGLKRANMNAQDGISYLQTAEGAMEQTGAILQRMRELAVQASNGTYTTSDRAEIQKEVDQLKSEINRISTSTEFNQRKLINGDGTAIWSSSSDKIQAIIRGPIIEGNYEIDMSVRPGKNQIQKSHIMTLKPGAVGVQVDTNIESYVMDSAGGTNATSVTSNSPEAIVVGNSAVTGPSNTKISGNLSIATGGIGATAPTGYYSVSNVDTTSNTATVTFYGADGTAQSTSAAIAPNDSVTFNITNPNTSGLVIKFSAPLSDGDNGVFAVQGNIASGLSYQLGSSGLKFPGPNTGAEVSSLEFDQSGNVLKNYNAKVTGTGIVAGTITVRQNFTNISGVKDPKSLESTNGKDITINVDDGSKVTPSSAESIGSFLNSGSTWSAQVDQAQFSGATPASKVGKSGYYELEVMDTKQGTVAGLKYRFRFIDPKSGTRSEWVPASAPLGSPNTITLNDTVNGSTFNVTVNVGAGQIQEGDKLLLSVSQPVIAGDVDAGGGTIQFKDPNGALGPNIVYTGKNDKDKLTFKDNGDHILNTNDVTVYKANIDNKTGNINLGSMVLEFKEESTGKTVAGMLNIIVKGGNETAVTTTKLKDLNQFVDSDGNNVLEYKQQLTIYANGKKTFIQIEGNDTIATLVEKLSNALIKDLGMGSDDPNVNANLVRYITIPDKEGWGNVSGTILIQSALTGKNSDISFIGNESLVKALGFAVVQQPEDNETVVNIRNAHTGELIGTEVCGDDRVYSILQGVEIAIDSRAGVNSTWDSNKNEIDFIPSPDQSKSKYFLHLVDNRTSLQIGANSGQDLDVSIPQLDLKGLGLENINLVSQANARRAIGAIDNALSQVVSARATVGAQVSRLEYTIQNLSTATMNLTTSESRIRDLDVAAESTALAKNQVLVQSDIAMLAQANQIPQYALSLIRG